MATSGRWSPNKVRKRLLDDTWVFPNSGMVLMRPTSIVSTGSGASATTGANGSVTFSSCVTLSLNGVFTSVYDNYMVVLRGTSSPFPQIEARLRVSGIDASGPDYIWRLIGADGTSIGSNFGPSVTTVRLGFFGGTLQSGFVLHMFGPFLTQPTAMRSVTASDYLSAYIAEHTATHSLSTSYDGISFIPTQGSITGLVSVYGLGG